VQVTEARMKAVLDSIAGCLRQERVRRAWTQATLADRCGVASHTVRDRARRMGTHHGHVPADLRRSGYGAPRIPCAWQKSPPSRTTTSQRTPITTCLPVRRPASRSTSATNVLARAVGQSLRRARKEQGLRLKDLDQKSGIYRNHPRRNGAGRTPHRPPHLGDMVQGAHRVPA
jgi:ribosome-binding protein aMBF1 (putative translation factor)